MPCQQPKAVAKDWAKLCETLMKLAMKGHARSASLKGFAIADGQAIHCWPRPANGRPMMTQPRCDGDMW